MWGQWGFSTFIGLALAIVAVISLSLMFSPLLAIVILFVVGIPLLFLAGARRRAEATGTGGSERPVTPEGKPTSPTGSRSGGEPASGGG
jgi:hypothetical protein